ncbi:MAG: hypothetical protein HKN31_06300, partial [Pricia sp.]|nr:hypothetical protein [Pricia sp.]
MNKWIVVILSLCILGCSLEKKENSMKDKNPATKKKVVYQVFTRLFGNTNTNNKSWGTV